MVQPRYSPCPKRKIFFLFSCPECNKNLCSPSSLKSINLVSLWHTVTYYTRMIQVPYFSTIGIGNGSVSVTASRSLRVVLAFPWRTNYNRLARSAACHRYRHLTTHPTHRGAHVGGAHCRPHIRLLKVSGLLRVRSVLGVGE